MMRFNRTSRTIFKTVSWSSHGIQQSQDRIFQRYCYHHFRQYVSTATEYRSPLESRFPPVAITFILCFPCDSNQQASIASFLQKSLEKTIRQNPPLAGRLLWEPEDGRLNRLKLITSNNEILDNVRFVANDLTQKPDVWSLSYPQLAEQGAPYAPLMRPEILSPPGGYQRLSMVPICAQANFIPGGCLLYISMNHSFMDDIGSTAVLESWARNCRELQEEAIENEDFEFQEKVKDAFGGLSPSASMSARSTRMATNGVPTLMMNQPEILQKNAATDDAEIKRILDNVCLWHTLGFKSPAERESSEEWRLPPAEGLVPAIFSAPAHAIARLKADSTLDIGFTSSFDAMAALIWRCVMRARYKDLEPSEVASTSHLRLAFDAREALGVRPDYSGNMLLFSTPKILLKYLVDGTVDGRHLAYKVRHALSTTKTRAHDAVKLSFMLPDPSRRVPDFENTTTTDIMLTSWRRMPLYKMDWGPAFGKPGNPEFVRSDQIGHLPGTCAILQSRSEDEVEVLVNLYPAQIERLKEDEEWAEYFKLKAI